MKNKEVFQDKIHMNSKTIKARFDNMEDFACYWREYDQKKMTKYTSCFSPEEMKEIPESTIASIRDGFKKSDEIIHYDNFDDVPERCGREYVLLVNGFNLKKSVLIRMS